MKTVILARRPVPMGDTERHIATVVRFGLKSALVAI